MECEAYNKELERKADEKMYFAWLQGQYVAEALMCTVCNSFRKKGSKPHEYPENPLEIKKRKTEELDIQKQRELFFAQMQVMSQNWTNTHHNKEENDGTG